MDKKKKILSHVFQYASAQYISQFIGFFTAIFMRRFLGPFNMGVWSILRVVVDYATYTHLGTTNAVYFRIPYHEGKGNLKEADNIKDVVFSYIALTSVIAGIGIAAYALLFRKGMLPQMFWGLLVVSVLLICQRIYTYYVMLLRAKKNFSVLSRSIVFDAVVNLGLVFLLIKHLGLAGLFIALIAMPILNVLFIRLFVKYDLKYRLDLNKLGEYIKFGFPIFITTFLVTILQSVDKIMIAKMIGLEALGVYSIALMTRGYGEGLSKNFTAVISPYFFEDYGANENMETAAKYVKISALLTSTFMLLLLGAMYIAIPPMIKYVLPKFTPGINAARLMLLTTFFYIASPQSSNFIVVMNKQMKLIPITSMAIALNVIFNFIFIRMGYGITGAAVATAIASFASFFVMLLYAFRHFENITKTLYFALRIIIPMCYTVAVLTVLDRMIVIGNVFLQCFVQFLLFFILFSPWIYIVNKRTKILGIIKAMILGKFAKRGKTA